MIGWIGDYKSEDDFEGNLIQNYREFFPIPLFPQVIKISGLFISPELDLISINFKERQVTGFEFKYLHYMTDKANFRLIREGLGQALLYFRYGVDFSYLVVGIPENVSKKVENYVYKGIRVLRDIIEKAYGFYCFNIWIYDLKNRRFFHPEARVAFPVNNFKDLKHWKDEFLSGRFIWNNKFLINYGLAPIEKRKLFT